MKTQAGIIGLCILCCVVLGGWMVEAKSLEGQASDLRTVWGLSAKVLKGDKKLLVKQGSFYQAYADKDDFEKKAVELSRKLNVPVQPIGMHEEHPVYQSRVQGADGAQLSLVVLGNHDQIMYVVVSRESTGEETIDRAEAWQKEMGETLRSVGIAADWNVVVQGVLQNSDSKKDAAEEFVRIVQKETGAKEIEKYKDSNTLSVTYLAPQIQTSVTSGAHRVNLQAAVHRVTENNEWRATFGTPLITTEY